MTKELEEWQAVVSYHYLIPVTEPAQLAPLFSNFNWPYLAVTGVYLPVSLISIGESFQKIRMVLR